MADKPPANRYKAELGGPSPSSEFLGSFSAEGGVLKSSFMGDEAGFFGNSFKADASFSAGDVGLGDFLGFNAPRSFSRLENLRRGGPKSRGPPSGRSAALAAAAASQASNANNSDRNSDRKDQRLRGVSGVGQDADIFADFPLNFDGSDEFLGEINMSSMPSMSLDYAARDKGYPHLSFDMGEDASVNAGLPAFARPPTAVGDAPPMFPEAPGAAAAGGGVGGGGAGARNHVAQIQEMQKFQQMQQQQIQEEQLRMQEMAQRRLFPKNEDDEEDFDLDDDDRRWSSAGARQSTNSTKSTLSTGAMNAKRARHRINESFKQLADLCGCQQKKKPSILLSAIEKVQQLESELRQLEFQSMMKKQEEQLLALDLRQEAYVLPNNPVNITSAAIIRSIGQLSRISSLPGSKHDWTEDYQHIIETGQSAIIVLSASSKIVECNQHFCNLVGYTRAEIIEGGMTIFQVTHPESMGDTLVIGSKLLAKPHVLHRYSKAYLSKSGSVVHAVTTTWLSFNREGHAKWCHAVVEPVTDPNDVSRNFLKGNTGNTESQLSTIPPLGLNEPSGGGQQQQQAPDASAGFAYSTH